MTRRGLRALLAGLLATSAILAPVLPAGPLAWLPGPAGVRAAEYTLETVASYDARVDAGIVGVQVEIEFTNTTPDPEGQFSVFDELKLAIHDEAERVDARDDGGALDVEVAVENDVNVATVTLREDLRYEDTVELRVTYVLPDTVSPQLRVRPSVVVFPAWGFGTSGEVRVSVPDGYEVLVDGDPLSRADGTLTSGPIDDPSAWLALVTAIRAPSFVEFDATVPLAGGTADLLVRAFDDDTAWGERTRDLAVDALPLIEEALGLPYPRIGPLVLTEAVAVDGSGFGEEATGGTDILVAFDQPPFTALHQLIHVWLSSSFAEARWIREGLASAVAEDVAAELDVALPYDPAERATEREADAFPLDTWRAGGTAAADAYGYAASWALLDEIEERVGPDAVRAVLARVVGGVGPYQSASLEPQVPSDGVTGPSVALGTRGFLDHLETVSGVALGDRFAEVALTEADAALLPARTEARGAFDALVTAAGSWGAPDPVRVAMTAWDFATAVTAIADAAAWLRQRDDLLADMEAVRLPAPDRLQQAYRAYGGGPEAIDELEAERAVVDVYREAAGRVNAERALVERIGLIGGPDPTAQLSLASGRFADGDLRGALDAIGEAQRIVDSAASAGVVRIISAVLLALLVLGLAIFLVRRRSSYTAAP